MGRNKERGATSPPTLKLISNTYPIKRYDSRSNLSVISGIIIGILCFYLFGSMAERVGGKEFEKKAWPSDPQHRFDKAT